MNGEYIQGSLVVQPRQGVDSEEAIGRMYDLDSRMRTDRGEQERGDVELDQSVSYQGLSEFKNIEKYVKDGMSKQGDKIVYDSKNSKHVDAITKLKSKVESTRGTENKDKADFMTKMTAQTVNGGDEGYKVSYQNTSQDKETQDFAKKTGLVGDEVESQVYAGEGSEDVVKNINDAKKLIDVDDEKVSNYYSAKEELYQASNEIIEGKEGDSEKGLNKLAKLGKRDGGNEKEIDKIMDDYSNLGGQLSKAEITREEYDTKVEGMYSNMQTSLKDQGVFANILTKEMSKSDISPESKEKFDKYATSKKELSDSGVTSDMVESFDKDEFDSLVDTLENIKGVDANKDGTLNIKSEGKLDDADTSRIIDKMRNIGRK